MSMVLLNTEGEVARKLQFVTVPDNYVVPDGMILSWRTVFEKSYGNPAAELHHRHEPVLAYFYLGSAKGLVERKSLERSNFDKGARRRYLPSELTITIQGANAQEVMALRDRVLHVLHAHASWDVHNDLNPPKKKKWFRAA